LFGILGWGSEENVAICENCGILMGVCLPCVAPVGGLAYARRQSVLFTVVVRGG